MSDAPLTTQEVQDAAKAQVNVGGETLVISNVYLWRNDQPRAYSTAEEASAAAQQGARAAHISLSIRRASGSPSSGDILESSVLPYVVAVHVIRSSQSMPSVSSASDSPPDAPMSLHFAWPAPPTMLPSAEVTEHSADAGGFFYARSMDGGDALMLSGWNGPRWGGLRNGIDDTVTYNAVVEFEGGIFLKSGEERLKVTY